MMRIVGLVGGSGTGKSTIAAHLSRKGAGHIDADRVAHEVLSDNEAVRRRIKARFGTKVFEGDDIDRGLLGRLVFENPGLLRALNSITHPVIIAECVERLEALQQEGKPLVVIDAALLLEVPVPFRIDLMIALRCSRDEQLRRLLAAGNATEEQIRSRLDNQAHIEKSFYRADVVVDTERPVETILAEIDRLIEFLLADEE
jgi:dephospho-CoA kinase